VADYVAGIKRKGSGTEPPQPKRSANDNGLRPKVKECPMPTSGPRPVIEFMLHWCGNQFKTRVLGDTGSTVPIISEAFCAQKGIAFIERDHPKEIRNFNNEVVKGAGKYYTLPLLLQHRSHFTNDSFEVAPLDEDCDVILPYWWLAKHQPMGFWQ
jgi:hypothetical protein